MVRLGMKAGVVGAGGEMGRWLTRHLAELGYEVTPIFTRTDQLDALGGLDLVVVSVPISATPGVLRAVAPAMRQGSVLAEIASLKEESHAALAYAACLGVKPLCIHPMFGPLTPSPVGRVIAVVPVQDAEAECMLTQGLFPGVEVISLDVARHDRCMAAVLSLPYAVNLGLARVLGDEYLQLASRLAGPTFTLQYTLAQSVTGENTSLTRDLLRCNSSLTPILRMFEDALNDVVWASEDEAHFLVLHSEIVERLSSDPSYPWAKERRQRAARAAAGV